MAPPETKFRQAQTLYKQLQDAWSTKTTDQKSLQAKIEQCTALLTKLKIILTEISFLPVSERVSDSEVILARGILEIGAFVAIEKKDITSFKQYVAQLQTYYDDFSSALPPAYKYHIIGLNLMCLLSENRLAEFHCIIEKLPLEEVKNNVYLRHPIQFDQYLSEGSYNKIFLIRDNVPAHNYKFFSDILLDTIRFEIARCIEKSYLTIKLSDASRMLFFENSAQTKQFAEEQNWKLVGGKNDIFDFATFREEEAKLSTDKLNTASLIKRTTDYAKELEMIV